MSVDSRKREQSIYELMLLYPDFRCTCDEVIRETEIHQAKGHYHSCMLWLVAHAIERSFMYSDGYRLVNGKMTLVHAQPTKEAQP